MSHVLPLTPDTGHLAGAGKGAPVRCHVFHTGRLVPPPHDLSKLSEILKDDKAFIWFDVVDPESSDLTLLEEEFDLHPLAIEDAVIAHQRPKIESYDEYWFVVIHGVTVAPANLAFHEMAIFVGKQYVVTVRHAPAYPLDEIERRWSKTTEGLHHDSGYLLYTILDTVTDGYFPVLETFQERIDDVEGDLFQGRPLQNALLQQIFNMKRDIQQFRRAALPMRDILNPIIRGDLALFREEELVYYRDVYDHAIRIVDGIDAARDLVNSALEIHLSVVANRQNEVSKQLTIIATIFLPLTFITGFFGQNFGVLVGYIQTAPTFWFWGLGSQIVVLILLLIYFKRRGWF